MSKLKNLIVELCPNGVEFKPLGEIAEILDNKRKPITKSARTAGKYPYYGANGIQDYVADYIFDGSFVLVGEDGSVINSNGTPVVNWAEGKIWVNNHAHIITEKEGVILRFLFHYIQTIDITSLVHGNIPKLTNKDFRELKIPVPPLEVQAEIVRILDTFIELTAKLTAELALRKKQYEYYRDKLLTFENVEFKPLGEIGKVSMCKRILKAQTNTEGGVPFYKIGTFGKKNDAFISYELWQDYKQRFSFPKNGEILISAAGTIGRTVIYKGEPAYWQDSNIVWLSHDEKIVLNKFLYYIYQTMPFKISTGGTIQRLYNGDIENTKIPVPPLAEQERIVNILDKFYKLCNDLSEGLPAEIKFRQQQYEYYRDKLLTFNEISSK